MGGQPVPQGAGAEAGSEANAGPEDTEAEDTEAEDTEAEDTEAEDTEAGLAEPSWLDDDLPPDPAGDDREWPGDLADVIARSDADEAEQAQIRWRLLAAGVETGFAHTPHTPGVPVVPGVQAGPGGGFAQGQPWDTAAPEVVLAVRADYASGQTRDFAAVSDDEVFGLLGARRRLEARQCWERLAVVAEIIRRRPAPGCKLRGAAAMPQVWAEGTAGELSLALAVDRRAADHLLGLAWDLQVKLPLTSSKLRDGVVDERKAATVSSYCVNLTAEEAGQAEAILFAHPGVESMTHGMLRDRIARAVMEVNPDAARKRRADAARECRIEVRPEESGNSMIAGRELPPMAVLRMDALISARARVFKKAGVDGDMDTLRVLAFLERFGEADPLADLGREPGDGSGGNDGSGRDGGSGDDGSGGHRPEPGGPGPGGSGPDRSDPGGPAGGACACGGTGAGKVPGGGIAARIHLTAPVATLTELAGRPGVLRGTGPVDPDMIRDLAREAARNPATGYDFTLTDADGRPVAHACGRPGPDDRTRRKKPGKSGKPGEPDGPERGGGRPGGPDPGPDPERGRGPDPGRPALTLIDRGPPGSYGRWRYTHRGREVIFEFEDLAGPCDHRYQAKGHDPGKHLKHLTAVLNQACTHPACRRPEFQCDYEHSLPYDRGGITCLCQAGPVCRRHHQDKQRPGWKVDGTAAPGWFRWRTPSGRKYLSGPTIYPT
jgi:hypothetical protein